MKPHRQRPVIPTGYGISASEDGLLEWARVAEAIADAQIYWLSSVSPSGEPHMVPLHAAGEDGDVLTSGDPQTRWCSNLRRCPAVGIGVDHDGLQVMIRGRARVDAFDAAAIGPVNEMVLAKYGFTYDESGTEMWRIEPSSAIAFDPARFATSPTRFDFGASR